MKKQIKDRIEGKRIWDRQYYKVKQATKEIIRINNRERSRPKACQNDIYKSKYT